MVVTDKYFRWVESGGHAMKVMATITGSLCISINFEL